MFTYSFLFLTLKFVIIKSTEIMKEPSSAVKKTVYDQEEL